MKYLTISFQYYTNLLFIGGTIEGINILSYVGTLLQLNQNLPLDQLIHFLFLYVQNLFSKSTLCILICIKTRICVLFSAYSI